jgi:hypothetical protein
MFIKRLRQLVIGLAFLFMTAFLFYSEEDLRGKRAWESARRRLEAKGVKFGWTNYIPPPVPPEQNFFAAPKMEKWFVQGGNEHLEKLLAYPRYEARDPSNWVMIASISLRRLDWRPVSLSPVIDWPDPQSTNTVRKLITDALGPFVFDPAGCIHLLHPVRDARIAPIYIRCDDRPADEQLKGLLPEKIVDEEVSRDDIRLMPDRSLDHFWVSIRAPDTIADFLEWGNSIAPEMESIRTAAQRPCARIDANYSDPLNLPRPDFVSYRTVVMRLSALARCHLLDGQPTKALGDVTLLHELRRTLEARPTGQPMLLVCAEINAAAAGVYADSIAEGIRERAWQDAQLAALGDQLKEIDLLHCLADAFVVQREYPCALADILAKRPWLPFAVRSRGSGSSAEIQTFYPRGWDYQDVVAAVELLQEMSDCLGLAHGEISREKIKAFEDDYKRTTNSWWPFRSVTRLTVPNIHCVKNTFENQTIVNQTRIACALERYRLAHGAYPETLALLVPQFIDAIPNDLIGGQAPRYRLNPDGNFLLYSIGWSGQDHGGQTNADLVWPEKLW